MMKVAELLGHTERVLNTALSPDGSTLVSAGADETLRLACCLFSVIDELSITLLCVCVLLIFVFTDGVGKVQNKDDMYNE